jgi:hypothetical protein
MQSRDAESLVFPVALAIPEQITAAGSTWFRRPELHVTTFTPADLAAASELDVETLVRAGEEHRDELTRLRAIRFDGRVARVEAQDGRRSLVAFCDVAGLDALYERLSAGLGAQLPLPPTHVTLYTGQPGAGGIGLTTEEQVRERATPLQDTDATAVLGHLPATA